MADKRDRLSIPPIGASSLLTAFAVLCLVVFALLTLTTVRADLRLSQSSAQAVTDYYAADCAAQEILARLRSGEVPEGVETAVFTDDSGPTWRHRVVYTYAVPVSDTLTLDVAVETEVDPSQSSFMNDYTVLRWQVVSNETWEDGGGMNVWNGTSP